jgi:hypothetical protein
VVVELKQLGSQCQPTQRMMFALQVILWCGCIRDVPHSFVRVKAPMSKMQQRIQELEAADAQKQVVKFLKVLKEML